MHVPCWSRATQTPAQGAAGDYGLPRLLDMAKPMHGGGAYHCGGGPRSVQLVHNHMRTQPSPYLAAVSARRCQAARLHPLDNGSRRLQTVYMNLSSPSRTTLAVS